jgi:arsenate reductase (thioredoxin)
MRCACRKNAPLGETESKSPEGTEGAERIEAVMTTVLFACVHNAGRSQMAAAFFNALADPTKARAISAGTAPAERVHPEVVEAMLEAGIDLRKAKPQRLTDQLAHDSAMMVTMGCEDACPVVPGARRLEWTLRDPKDRYPSEVREIRDEIRSLVESLVRTEGVSK